jgi:hypothetical protein
MKKPTNRVSYKSTKDSKKLTDWESESKKDEMAKDNI